MFDIWLHWLTNQLLFEDMFEKTVKFRSKHKSHYEPMEPFGDRNTPSQVWPDSWWQLSTRHICGIPQEDVSNRKFVSPVTRIPWRALCLALFLMVFGTVVIVVSVLILFGFIVNIRPNDGLLVLTFLGFLMFIPGFYHIRIAYYAYHQYDGYNFDDIPDFDWLDVYTNRQTFIYSWITSHLSLNITLMNA